MQYIALDAATMISGERGTRLVPGAGWHEGPEHDRRRPILRARLYPRMGVDEGSFRGLDLTALDMMEEDNISGLTAWKRLTVWAAAALASWAVVIGCVAIVRALLA